MKITKENIVDKMPYERPFLFVDEITELSENKVVGTYTFRKSEYFYKGHFRNNPITPGVILIECMAQIGLVGMGLYIMREELKKIPAIAFSTSEIQFLKMVLPGEKVVVESERKYFRLGKLKCKVVMRNAKKEMVCKGELSGVIIHKKS